MQIKLQPKIYIETLMNNYTQAICSDGRSFNIYLPSNLNGFIQTAYQDDLDQSSHHVIHLEGYCEYDEAPICPHCGCGRMHANIDVQSEIKHIPYGDTYTVINLTRKQYRCRKCGRTHIIDVPFKGQGHNITQDLYDFIVTRMQQGLTINAVAIEAGVHWTVVKDIHKKLLEDEYTVVDTDGKRKLIKPKQQATLLMIDEFKLHQGHDYATHIIDGNTGAVLWIAHGKKKQVVYDFIEHVGSEWMSHVKTIACDMNADYEAAFLERCPHLNIVYDHFHIVKNFNEHVVSAIRKDEQKRLCSEGKTEEAKRLKRSKYILLANRETLEKRDSDAGKIVQKGSKMFNIPEVKRKGGRIERLNAILDENKLLNTCELIKETLRYCYSEAESIPEMEHELNYIIMCCEDSGNEHLLWFKDFLKRHWEGILNYQIDRVSSGKIEGINNRIKTTRRQAYGFNDDDYFFLRIIADSHQKAIIRKNHASNK